MKHFTKYVLTVTSIFGVTFCSNNNNSSSSNENKNHISVSYFSITGYTEIVANTIANYLNADSFEIIAKDPYEDEDLQYNDTCRSAVEQNDDSARPEILNSVTNISNYDVIFLGYPIWYSKAPRIIYTFLESYDFSNKTIIPFCTSDNSPIGETATNLYSLTTGAQWNEGKRFSHEDNEEYILNWVNSLKLQ